MSFFARFTAKVNEILVTAGQDAKAEREVDSGSTDRYGKPVTSWDEVATVKVVPFSGSRFRYVESTDSGRFRRDEQKVAFSLTANVEEDDRLTFGGKTYRVDTIDDLPTHSEAKLMGVTE